MRVSAAAVAAISATLGLLLAAADRTSAQSGCQAAFEKWAQMSEAQVRRTQGGCVPSESVRRSLLDALAQARALCGDSSDASLQPTRIMISINQSFIASLGVCRTESADVEEDGWSSKAAPEKPPPKIAAPIIPPTPPPSAPPVTGGPRPSVISPKPVVVAPPVSPPKAEAGTTAAPKPPCLEVAAVQGDVYSFINRRCKGHTVLAVIETRTASGQTGCKGYSVGAGLNLKGASAPRVNYECLASAGACNKDRLGDMFPECDW
jgi:hypothetical protein